MAVFALCIGFDMVCGFASRHFFVVAGKATIDDWRVVNVNLRPVDLSMALAALRIGARMGDWLALSHIAVVAAGATGGHALEHAADMADFAGDILVSATQRESRLAVVEVLVNFCEAIGRLGKS